MISSFLDFSLNIADPIARVPFGGVLATVSSIEADPVSASCLCAEIDPAAQYDTCSS